MYDLKVYEDGVEKETIRGLTLAQTAAVQIILDRHGINHAVKRLGYDSDEAAGKAPPDYEPPRDERIRCPECGVLGGHLSNCPYR